MKTLNQDKICRYLFIGISAVCCFWLVFALGGLIWILNFPSRLGQLSLSYLPIMACGNLLTLSLYYPAELGEIGKIPFIAFIGLVPLLLWGLGVRLILRSNKPRRLLTAGLVALCALLGILTIDMDRRMRAEKMQTDLTRETIRYMQAESPTSFKDYGSSETTPASDQSEYYRLQKVVAADKTYPRVSALFCTFGGGSVDLDPPLGLEFRDPEKTVRDVLKFLTREIPELEWCEVMTNTGKKLVSVHYDKHDGITVSRD
jgi:hypothetical protein